MKKTKHMIGGLGLPAVQIPSKGGRLEIVFNHIVNDLVNHAYIIRLTNQCGHQSSVELPDW